MEVRRVRDASALARLNLEVQSFHRDMRPEAFKDLDFEATYRAMTELLSYEGVEVFIAFDGEAAVGYAITRRWKYAENPYRPEYHALEIDQMGVTASSQRQGVGTLILEAIKEYAAAQGYRRLELSVWSANAGAKALYRRAGFETFTERMELSLE